MPRKSISVCELLFKVMITAQTLLYAVIPFFGKTKLESLLMYIVLLGMLGIMVFGIILNAKAVDKVGFLLFALLTAVSFISALWTGQAFSYPVLIALLNFFVTYAPFFVVGFVVSSKNVYQYVRRMGVVQAVIMILVSYSSKGYAPYYASGYLVKDGALTLGFVNPNVTAAYLFYVFSINLYNWKNERNIQKRGSFFVLICMLWYLIFKTECRTLIVISLLMVTLSLVSDNQKLQKTSLSSSLMIACIALPLTFLLVFGFAYKNYSTLQIMGEDIFSRMEIFQEAYVEISRQPILGNVSKHQFGNTHNGYLAIMLNVGIVGIVSYLSYIVYHLNGLRKKIVYSRRKNIIPYIYLLFVFVHSCVEAGGLIGGALFGTNMLMFCYLCVGSEEEYRTI